MDLIVDDRERSVIKHFEHVNVTVKRLTVGDYVFAYMGRVIVIVERKTLRDLASSIKDGRMGNHKKLKECRDSTRCKILYIIEGPAYPAQSSKFGRIPFKSLQGKIDSLMFRHNSHIIWTKNEKHTAERLEGLYKTYITMVSDGVFGEFKTNTLGGVTPSEVVKRHVVCNIDIHVEMIKQLRGISYCTARASLNNYNITQLLLNNVSVDILFNMKYQSGYSAGKKGLLLKKRLNELSGNTDMQEKIITCIPGITLPTSKIILSSISFDRIVGLDFKNGEISGMKKTKTRKIGNSAELKMRKIFTIAIANTIFEPTGKSVKTINDKDEA